MIICKKYFSLLMILLMLPFSVVFSSTNGYTNTTSTSIYSAGVGHHLDSFDDMTFYDPISSVYGWGMGALSKMRNFTWENLDFYPTENPTTSIDIEGRLVYAAGYNEMSATYSINCFDINNASDIRRLGYRNSLTSLHTIAVDGDVLYTGTFFPTQTFNSYNISNHFGSGGMGEYLDQEDAPDGICTDIEPYGHLVFWAAYGNARSLRITDASNPYNLRPITHNWSNSNVYGLDVKGQLAYVAAYNEGFYVLNISNKWSPIEIGYLSLPGNITDVLVDGPLAYITAGYDGIYIVNVFDPANPALIGKYDTYGYAQRLALQGKTLFVADGFNGLVVLDVFNPEVPVLVSQVMIIPPYTYDVDIYGGFLVLGTEVGIYTLKICGGNGITDLSKEKYHYGIFDDFFALDVRVQGDIAYVAGGSHGFYTLNVSNPMNPVILDHFMTDIDDSLNQIEVNGQFAYCVGWYSIYTFDVSDPSNIILTRNEIGTDLEEIALAGPLAYVSFKAPGPTGYASLNYTYAYGDGFTANYYFGTNISALDVQGRHIYFADNSNAAGIGVYIYDIMPDPLYSGDQDGYFDGLWSYGTDLVVDGDFLYLSDRNWLVFFNVTDPFNPSHLGDVSYKGDMINSRGVWVFGQYILSASGSEGIYLVDSVNYRNTMEMLGSNYPNATNARRITTHGDYTYVANTSSLIILRHFEGAGTTFVESASVAQSKVINAPIDGVITSAKFTPTFLEPQGTDLIFFMSADGGAHWEIVDTSSIETTFTHPGDELRWRAVFEGPSSRSSYLYDIKIDYTYNLKPSKPTMNDLRATYIKGSVKVTWTESMDDVKVDYYNVQMSDDVFFTTIVKEANTSKLSKTFYPVLKGTYYFRVQAVDNQGLPSGWSNVRSTTMRAALLRPLWIGLAGVSLIAIIGIIALVAIGMKKKRAIPTR